MIRNTTLIQQLLKDLGYLDVVKLNKIGYGEWSSAFSFVSNNEKKIIRFADTYEDFKKDEIAHNLASSQIPVPRIEKIGKIEDKYYCISEFLNGEMIDNLTSEELSSSLPSFINLLINLKNIDISKTTGFGGWSVDVNGEFKSWRDFIIDVKNENPNKRFKWKNKLEQNQEIKNLYESTYDHMLSFLDYLPNERSLIHNDLLHYNLLVKDTEISGVIDWGCSLYGDFLYDLAMFALWGFYYEHMASIDFVYEAEKYFKNNSIKISNYYERLTCYQLHLALDSLQYSTFTGNQENINLMTKRINEIIGA